MAFPTAPGRRRGFTLIELLVVMAIIATLMTLVMPQYFRQHTKAQETVLRHNLVSIRQALDHYREDKGKYPDALDELVSGRYLREVPRDPLTGRSDTWQLQHDEDSGIGDVHSGAPGRGVDGTDYGNW
ncbi:type II secretion system protein [Pseudomonas vanderleydeniana]|uniref:Type II secretion system GspH family protein n=1 Tax=Pseudomonas vanderleydeniana TaxID=2745495 RepID=A0A9E6PKE2_9PSED|nr:prepilin-type N-terminal cleavage/methylation domain-containing protein [Pseudomonas vanderleydeniana]QXI28098.1 type II secretion system GspH family protein [Pseudomonas vanderleydeniana]